MYPGFIRSKEDLMRPFLSEESLVRKAGLRLHSIEKVLLKSPAYEHLLNMSTKDTKFLSEFSYCLFRY